VTITNPKSVSGAWNCPELCRKLHPTDTGFYKKLHAHVINNTKRHMYVHTWYFIQTTWNTNRAYRFWVLLGNMYLVHDKQSKSALYQFHSNLIPVFSIFMPVLYQFYTSFKQQFLTVLYQIYISYIPVFNSFIPDLHQLYTSFIPVLYQFYSSSIPDLHQFYSSSITVLYQRNDKPTFNIAKKSRRLQ
jgi:hypothetical protein